MDLVEVTLRIPRSIAEKMKEYPEYKWSKIAAATFKRVLKKSDRVNNILNAASRGDMNKIKRISEKLRNNYCDINIEEFKE